MVMAPLNVQILPHHQQNGVGHKSSKKSNNHHRRRNRSPKKFLVFPVEDVECELAGNGMAKVEGRIVTSKVAQMNGKNGWICQKGRKKIEELEEKNNEENGKIELNDNIEEQKMEINLPKLAETTEDLKEEDVKKEGMNGFVGDGAQNGGGQISKFGVAETVKIPTIAQPKWTTGPAPIKAKVILLGESGVGKTSLVYSLKYGCSGLLPCNATIGAHHTNLDINAQHNGNVAIQMQLWDTAGQERFRSMGFQMVYRLPKLVDSLLSYWSKECLRKDGKIPMYLRNVNGALLVYDLTSRKSFEQIEFWIRELNRSTALDEKAPILLLIGNKNDQEGQREVSREEGMAKADQIGADYFELAAIHTNAIRTIFQTLADKLAEKLSAKFDEVEEVDERMNLEMAPEEMMMGMEDGMEMFSRELRELCKKNGTKCCSIS